MVWFSSIHFRASGLPPTMSIFETYQTLPPKRRTLPLRGSVLGDKEVSRQCPISVRHIAVQYRPAVPAELHANRCGVDS